MVKNLFKNGADMIFRRQTNILSAATVIGVTVLVAQFLGLFKYRLLTARFDTETIGLFLAAFRLPSTVFDIIVMGALTTAFIPVFTSYVAQEKEKEANIVASTILNLSILVFLGLSVIFLIFTRELVHFTALGLSPAELDIVVPFTRIMLIGQTLPLILGNFLTGILQSHKRFLLPAIAPVLYNLGIITGIIFLSPVMGIYSAVWGVVIGAILFLLIQLPLVVRVKFRYLPVVDLASKGVRDIGKLILPRTLGMIVAQVNYTVNLNISSLISTGAITIFNFAQQLEQVPVRIFAITIAQAALPTLSEEYNREDDLQAFKKTLLTSFHQILFLVLPAAAILIVLRIPVVRLVYGAPEFDWPATVDTGRTLAFLGLGLAAEAVAILLSRAFYALHDSRTPVSLASAAIVVNIILSIVFTLVLRLPIWGLALSAAIADSLFAMILLLALHRRVGGFSVSRLVLPAAKMFTASLLTGISLYIPMKILDQLVFDTTRTLPLLALTGTATIIGLSVYLFLTWLLEIEELNAFTELLRKAKKILFAAEETVSEVASEVTPAVSHSTNEEPH